MRIRNIQDISGYEKKSMMKVVSIADCQCYKWEWLVTSYKPHFRVFLNIKMHKKTASKVLVSVLTFPPLTLTSSRKGRNWKKDRSCSLLKTLHHPEECPDGR